MWQRRFWEHTTRDEDELTPHVGHLHYNPVKHGLVTRAADWPHSSIDRLVEHGLLTPDRGLAPHFPADGFGEHAG